MTIPISIRKGALERTEGLAEAITSNLSLLVSTPRYLTAADPHFGFVFNNLKFENVNEKEGVVYNRKLSGSSKNINTYAAELQKAILEYEPRLQDVKVNMTYVREEKQIYTTVDAVISETQKPYQFTTTIKVWR
ncbi:MAG: GPW/gp25 family protein [Paludibacteraceae bacterium]|nr:GPW/gp25 family protein [Paludibacteraceae bacterium]